MTSSRSSTTYLAAPKDAGTVTITVEAQCWIYNYPSPTPTTFDTLTDTLAIKVEAPTVNSFQVSNDAGAGVAAAPFWFGTTTAGTTTPSSTGTDLTFMMAGGSPLARDNVGFWADVTNTTHYDLRIGVVQIVDINLYASFTNGTSTAATGTDDLDWLPGWSSYWYQDQTLRFNKGVRGTTPVASVPFDSPYFREPASSSAGFLQTMKFHMQFDTHLAVGGGWLPSGPEMGGFPIALSTAQWHLDGEAVNTANSTNPGAATVATTTNMANWTVSLASGSGLSPTTLPGANAPWTALGDGAIKYINYDGNSYDTLAALGSSASAAWPIPGAAHDDPSTDGLRDRAAGLLGPVPLPMAVPGPDVLDPRPSTALRWRPAQGGRASTLLREADPARLGSLPPLGRPS